MTYDLAIIGGGPAGVAAGVYAARKKLRTIFITKDYEGQSYVSEGIENWIGTVSISGPDLTKSLRNHLEAYKADVVDTHTGEYVTSIEKVAGGNSGKTSFSIKTPKNTFEARTLLITSGSYRRKLEVPGAKEFENKGISYCASCDGPLFKNKDVAVIGGGNAAFESAAQLQAYCKSVTILQRGSEFRADPITVEKVLSFPNIKAVTNTQIDKIEGNKYVTSLTYTNKNSGKQISLPVEGIFVEIGLIPNTDFVKSVVELDKHAHIKVDPRNQRAIVAGTFTGIWAAGDCSDGLYHQNNIAAGDAVKALEDIYLFLHASK